MTTAEHAENPTLLAEAPTAEPENQSPVQPGPATLSKEADDPSPATTGQTSPEPSSGEPSQQQDQPVEPDFKVIIAVYGPSALAGVQSKGKDPHIEVIESSDPHEIATVIPEIVARAHERWDRNPKNRRHSPRRPATPTSTQPQRPRTRTVQEEPETQTKLF